MTSGVYKGLGRNQLELMTRAYWEFLRIRELKLLNFLIPCSKEEEQNLGSDFVVRNSKPFSVRIRNSSAINRTGTCNTLTLQPRVFVCSLAFLFELRYFSTFFGCKIYDFDIQNQSQALWADKFLKIAENVREKCNFQNTLVFMIVR